jgi:hypothetical protein
MDSPADAIEQATRAPAGADVSMDLFAAHKARLTGIPAGMQASPFDSAPKYPVNYHCQRFVIGQTMTFNAEGKKEYEPTNDDDELTRIMQLRYDGGVAVINRLDTFLQDGTVVVWLEWLTPKESPSKAEARPAHARTVGELLDPRVPPASDGAVPVEAKGPPPKSAQGSDVFASPDDERFVGEVGESYEDEDAF